MSEKDCINIKGYCKLYKGDCLEVMKKIPDNKVDMILCDLPYGTTACSWDIIIPFDKLWIQYKRIIKDKGAIVLFGSEPFSSMLRVSNIKMFKYDWIWKKNNVTGFQTAKIKPLKEHEIISVFSKSMCSSGNKNNMVYYPQNVTSVRKEKIVGRKPKYNGQRKKQEGKHYISEGENYPKSILCYSRDNVSVHPTQKPIELLEYLIKTYTKENETVLDNCMGSGSTGVACINTGRKFIGIEQDEHFYKVSCGRIKQQIQYKEDYGEW